MNLDLRYIEIATCVNYINKYYPKIEEFKLDSLVNNAGTMPIMNQKSNIKNKDKSMLNINKTNQSNTIKIRLPKEYTINYPDKFIPPGTRFMISYVGGDITKPNIVGRIDNG